MKKYLSLLFLSAFSLLAWANPVDREQAKQAAQLFLQSKGIKKEVSTIANKARLAPNHRATANATNPYYVFNIGQKEGYVIASG
ncbi:MAG: Spi family protease inhibitor, partial [Bacteroidaceae bacterium]|nr:Spi family protease inhibitor [Bacteroidaceae bacterium]